MKQLFLIIFLTAFAASAYSQSYCTMASCGNDTLRYIERNYQDNADSYVGKTIGNWADQSELKLNHYKYIPIEHSPWAENETLIGKIKSIRIEVPYSDISNIYVYYVYIYIHDSTPLSWAEEGNLEGDYDEYWSLKFYNFYKDAKIKKISIGKEINGKFNNSYRRP